MKQHAVALVAALIGLSGSQVPAQTIMPDDGALGAWSRMIKPWGEGMITIDATIVNGVGEMNLDTVAWQGGDGSDCRYLLGVEGNKAQARLTEADGASCRDTIALEFRRVAPNALELVFDGGAMADGLGPTTFELLPQMRPLLESEVHPDEATPDILGVRLGMSQAEATSLLGEKGFALLDEAVDEGEGYQIASQVWSRTDESGEDNVALQFTAAFAGEESEPRVKSLIRNWSIAAGSSVSVGSLRDSLDQKYGTGSRWRGAGQLSTRRSWTLDRTGSPVEPDRNGQCIEEPSFTFRQIAQSLHSGGDLPASCLAMVSATIGWDRSDENFATDLDVEMLDLDLSLRDAWKVWLTENQTRLEAEMGLVEGAVTPEL